VIDWLAACRARDLDRLMTFYDAKATLDCACTGEKLCNNPSELRNYWRKRLADPSPATFTLQDIWPSGDATVLDYISHNRQFVRSFFYFGDNGLVTHTRCGPVELAKAS
jgi:ketosteroid isomerase-like protein